jgi:hypothetical protein
MIDRGDPTAMRRSRARRAAKAGREFLPSAEGIVPAAAGHPRSSWDLGILVDPAEPPGPYCEWPWRCLACDREHRPDAACRELREAWWALARDGGAGRARRWARAHLALDDDIDRVSAWSAPAP